LKVVRSVLSVVIGFGLFVAALQLIPWLAELTGFDGTGMSYMMMSIAWTIIAAMICGFVTGLIAGAHEVPHASGLGLLMIGLSFLSMQQESISRPTWYQTAIAGCGPISAMFGAGIRMLFRVRQGTGRSGFK
jgi:hypothetical protein